MLFENNTTSRRAELERDLQNLNLGAGESIIKFVGRAKGIRNDLATVGVRMDEHDLSLAIVAGLPAAYSMISTVLKNKDVPLRLPMVTDRLLTTEKELVAVMSKDVPPAVPAYIASLTHGSSSGSSSKGKKKKEEDFKKPVCFYCKRPGHKIADCYKRKRSDKRKGDGHGNDKDKADKRDEKKLAYVARMISKAAAQAAVGTQADEWVADSGATHHLATDKANFSAIVRADVNITTASDGTL